MSYNISTFGTTTHMMRHWNIVIIHLFDCFHQIFVLISPKQTQNSNNDLAVSLFCQPNWNRYRERVMETLQKHVKNRVQLNKCTNRSFSSERLPGEPCSSRARADTQHNSGHCLPGRSPPELTGALSETQPPRPSAFYHRENMTTHLSFCLMGGQFVSFSPQKGERKTGFSEGKLRHWMDFHIMKFPLRTGTFGGTQFVT